MIVGVIVCKKDDLRCITVGLKQWMDLFTATICMLSLFIYDNKWALSSYKERIRL
jgi:hypothetical protein